MKVRNFRYRLIITSNFKFLALVVLDFSYVQKKFSIKRKKNRNKNKCWNLKNLNEGAKTTFTGAFNRGGVEDTRLEAKAKDTKKYEAKAKDSLSEDRHSRGQGQECSRRPRTKDTSASALQKKRSSKKIFRRSPKKRSSQKFFKRSPQKNVFQKIFQALHKILTIQKIVLSSSRGQANFRGLEASRPRPRT